MSEKTQLQRIEEMLQAIEIKLHKVNRQLDQITEHLQVGAEQETQEHEIDIVERYISNSGNVTWKAWDQDVIIYLRQSHRVMLEQAGLWSQLNAMDDGERCKAFIRLATVADGDFRRPVSFDPGGVVYKAHPDDEQRAVDEIATRITTNLEDVLNSGDFIVLDTETNDLHGYPVQIGILDHDGVELLNMLVKPPFPITSSAMAVHGISDEQVASEPEFKDPSLLLPLLRRSKYIIGWNVTYDRDVLLRAAEYYGLDDVKAAIKTAIWRDVMTPFAAVYGEWNEYHQSYKWQKLTTAASYYGISTNGAHGAIQDCRMTLEVLKRMVSDG